MSADDSWDFDSTVDESAPGGISHARVPVAEPSANDRPYCTGPVKERACTDVLCLFLFLACFGAFVVIAAMAFIYGDPRLFLYPVDSAGKFCGAGEYRDKQKLFFFDLTQCVAYGPGVFVIGCPTPQVCVSECPDTNFVTHLASNDKDKLICKPGVDKSKESVSRLVSTGLCASYYLRSISVLNRCVPDVANLTQIVGQKLMIAGKHATDALGKIIDISDVIEGNRLFHLFLNSKKFVDKVIMDVTVSWRFVFGILVLTSCLTMLWIIGLRCWTGYMVFSSLLLFIGVFVTITAVCLWKYHQTKSVLDFQPKLNLQTLVDDYLVLIAIVNIGICVFLLLTFCCMLRSIRLSVLLLKEGSRAMQPSAGPRSYGNIVSVLLWPSVVSVAQLLVLLLWFYVAVSLVSAGRRKDVSVTNSNVTEFQKPVEDRVDKHLVPQKSLEDRAGKHYERMPCKDMGFIDKFFAVAEELVENVCGVFKNMHDHVWSRHTTYQLFSFFMLLWQVDFLSALGDVTLAGVFALYYWRCRDWRTDLFPLLSSLARGLRFHLGTMAFGSLLRSIIGMLRWALSYARWKLEAKAESTEQDGYCRLCNLPRLATQKCLRWCLVLLTCLCWCLEHLIDFINKNAFIMVAVYGKNYCMSGRYAFQLIRKYIHEVAIADAVIEFVLFMSKYVIVGLVAFFTFFVFEKQIPYLSWLVPEVHFVYVPLTLVVVGAFVITSAFLSVYGVASQTLLLCVLTDLDQNDGSPEKPYHMNKELREVLGVENQTDDGREEDRCCCF